MADDYLLVPMQVDALVVNRAAKVETPFLRFRMEYENLQQFNSSEPRPFDNNLPQPDAGVCLHWTLPKSLRHGMHKDDGSTAFPLLPNRWLIVRTSAGRAAKAWILESDYLDKADGSTPGTSHFIDPGGLAEGGIPKATKIGRALRLTPDLKSLAAQNSPFLRAPGPGNVTFSIFAPGVENVLSFYDDVTENDDQTQIVEATFSYSVTGWYSDPAHDPLSDPNLEWVANTDPKLKGTFALDWKPKTDPKLINYSFDWYVESASGDLPKRMLVHTLVSAVPWKRDADNTTPANYPSDIGNTVKVAIGNTAIDALAAIVRLDENSQTEADLLEAFQYNLLDRFDEPGSAQALNMAIRERWFGTSPGGKLWTIVVTERTDNTALPAPPVPVVTDDQQHALAKLNAQQAELDRQQRILESMQWNLFSLWWKYNWQLYNTIPDTDVSDWLGSQLPLHVGVGSNCNQNPVGTDPAQESWYLCKVQAQQNLVAQLTTEVNNLVAQLTGTGASGIKRILDKGQDLKVINRPQYYYPNDPVVLVKGLGRSTNFDPIGPLLCRLPSQTISKLTVGNTTYTSAGSGGVNIQNQIPALDDPHNLLPEGVQHLHTESFFLSPYLFAKDILGDTAPDDSNDALANEVRDAIKSVPAPSASDIFAPPSFAMQEWQQPWVPLLLSWQVTLLKDPAYICPQNDNDPHATCTLDQSNWQFDGTDYRWAGPTTSDGGNFDESTTSIQLTGRTFITPHLNFTLAGQLDDYVKQHQMRDPTLEGPLENLDKYLDEIANQDILSQRLSGIMAMLIQRQFVSNVAPSGDILAALGHSQDDSSRAYHHGYPMPSQNERETFATTWNFAPLAGTFFVINKLTVIDSFGRSIDLMLSNYSGYSAAQIQLGQNGGNKGSPPEDYFFPIAGRGMKAFSAKDPAPGQGISNRPAERMIQLTPRLIQDSRLDFQLLSNDGQNNEVERSSGTNPICGWLVPNHLDRSLAVYSPDGTAWGELYLSKHAQDKYVPVWQPDPTKPANDPNAPQSVADIPNLYLKEMLQALWNRTDDGNGFYDLIQVIDETLWSINPRGQRRDQDLSVLIGRPLAVVRARLRLEMRGLPFYRQDWWDTFNIGIPPPDSGDSTPVALGAFDGGVFNYLWSVRLGSNAMRNDGVIGYYLDDPKTPGNTFQGFNSVNLPSDIKTDYLKQIGLDNYLQLRFVDDTITYPDPARNQSCEITMLVDPRGQIHAFTGLLPVVTLNIPSEFTTPALRKMSFMFRAGPFLSSPDEVRIPRPTERKGTWSWFDYVLNTTTDLAQADGKVSLSTTPPMAREGWLKFTPNPPRVRDLKKPGS
jgi:hypothetical protein